MAGGSGLGIDIQGKENHFPGRMAQSLPA